MAAPEFQAAGTGTREGAWSTSSPAEIEYPTGIAAGHLLLCHFECELAASATTPTDWTLLYGPLDLTSLRRSYIFAKSATGSESGLLSVPCTVGGTSQDAAGRIYRFTGWANSATMADNFEGGSFGTGTDATIEQPSITTSGAERLCVAFVHVADDNALDAFTGTTGGTWGEAVAEYAQATGDDFAMGLQTATLASAGTISGGVDTMAAADPWGVQTFAIKPVASALPPRSLNVNQAVTRASYW